MANPPPGAGDWIELFNTSDSALADLSGLYLGTSQALFQIRTPGYVAPKGHVRLWADQGAGGDHLDFKLPAAGDRVSLYDATGRPVDQISYATQPEGTSDGRLPDGASVIVRFTDTPTPGSANTLILLPKLAFAGRSAVDDRFQFQIVGRAGATYIILTSTDLIHWEALNTVVAAGPVTDYRDTVHSNNVTRFYRLELQSAP
jgi:hypothetical protein